MTLLLYFLATIGTAACAFTSYLWFRIDRERQVRDGLRGSAVRAQLYCLSCRRTSSTSVEWPFEIEEDDRAFIEEHRRCRDGGTTARTPAPRGILVEGP